MLQNTSPLFVMKVVSQNEALAQCLAIFYKMGYNIFSTSILNI